MAGLEPSKGSETCTVNEAMYSLLVAASVAMNDSQTVKMLDMAERIAINALPAPWRNGSMWGLQYHHQVNAFSAPQHAHDPGVDPDSLGFGLPYECCAANSQQGWPRYAERGLAMRSVADQGLFLTGYTPATTVDGQRVVSVTGSYPFDDDVPIRIICANRGPAFPLWLRVPGWAARPSMTIQTAPARSTKNGLANGGGAIWLAPGTLRRVVCGTGNTTIVLSLPMAVRVERRLHGAVAVSRGPSLYGLPVNVSRVVTGAYYPPHGVDESLVADGPWRFGLVLPPAGMPASAAVRHRRAEIPPGTLGPWVAGAVRGGVLDVTMRQINAAAWPAANCTTNFGGYVDSCPGSNPQSPLSPADCSSTGCNDVSMALVPFGALDVGLAELPFFEGVLTEGM